jgi:GNAT superfamily N-acetyltransferase
MMPPAGYELVDGPPSVADYLTLRVRSGLSARTPEQAKAGQHGAWAAVHVIHQASGTVVGMGRILGDGGWYFHVIDMAILPEHQRRGLGDAILSWLLAQVRGRAPVGAVVNLIADPPGRRLYERHGFVATAPRSEAMTLRLE